MLWDYNSSIAAPVPRVLNHPQPLKYNEPLPIAHLSTTGSSSDIGIVIVYPNTGKISYRENLDSVDSLSLFQRHRQGVEGVFKLMNGETVVDVVDVKDAGYVLVLSSGRLAHFTVRDQQGRPAIAVSQMNSEGPTKGSWFGSFSSILGGGWRNTLAAVKAHPSNRSGQMEVIATTVEGTYKFWDVSHDGQTMFKYQLDTFEEIRKELITKGLMPADSKAHIQVMDFAIVKPPDNAVARLIEKAGVKVVVLVAYEEQITTHYVLLHFTLHGEATSTRVTPIVVYNPPTTEASKEIRLLVPQNGHTAFLVASNAVVVVSSLDTEKVIQPPFQDVVYFRSDKGTQIVSSSIEAPRASSNQAESSILLFTQSYGAVRITADKGSEDADRQKVSAKSKIEQAIFFGTKPNNLLNLNEISGFAFSTREAQDAALQISQEILQSTSEFVPDVMSSLDSQINLRIKALRDLVVFMRETYSPLSREVKWSLLLDAERMASASSLWHMHEKWLAKRKNKEDTMLHHYLEAINEKHKTELVKEKGEVDPVREWLTRDMARIEKLFTWIPSVSKERSGETSDVHELIEDTLEAYDIFEAGLQTAFDFRTRSKGIYGLEDEELENGILRANYKGLPEMWTARTNTVNSISKSVRAFGKKTITLRALLGTHKDLDRAQVAALSKAYPKLVLLSCLTYTERAHWLLAQESEEDHASGQRYMHQYLTDIRPQQLLCTAELGQAFAGMDIAEKLRDMKSLVNLILHELEFAPDDREYQIMKHPGQMRADKHAKELNDKIEEYFQKFGSKFARAFFSAHVENGQLANLLERDFGKGKQLTEFLRSDPEYFKLCWLNDVTAEKDLLHAGKALMAVAQNKENNIWSKHAELSIAKLSLLASKAGNPVLLSDGKLEIESNPDDLADVLLNLNQAERQVAKIQEDLYNHLKPTFQLGLNDEQGKVNLVTETFGQVAVEDRPGLEGLLRQGFGHLYSQQILDISLLIDVLTLMDDVSPATEKVAVPSVDICGREFSMALHVLDSSGWCNSLNAEECERGELLKKLIWKRLFIRDDWEAVNDTKGKSDEISKEQIQATLLYATLREGLQNRKSDFAQSFAIRTRLTILVIWEDAQFSSTREAWTIPAPTDVLGAASHPEDLEWRFPDRDEEVLRMGIANDNAQDDEILTSYLSKFRMGSHFDAVKQVAFDDVRKEFEDAAAEVERVREFEAGYTIPIIENRNLIVYPDGQDYVAQSAGSSPRHSRRFSMAKGYEHGDEEGDEDEDMDMEDSGESYEEQQGYDQEDDYEDREGRFEDE